MEEQNSTTTTVSTTRNYSLSLNLNGAPTTGSAMNGNSVEETRRLLESERKDSEDKPGEEDEQNPLLDASQRDDSFGSDASSRKIKMSKLQTTATKSVALKRWVAAIFGNIANIRVRFIGFGHCYSAPASFFLAYIDMYL